MRKTTTAMQAAVVTMLVAKRPALDKLPICWVLRPDGTVHVEPHYGSKPSDIESMATELARSMRDAKTETYDVPDEDKNLYRVYEVKAQPSGVRVTFYGQRPLDVTSSEAALVAEGGDL